MDHTTALNRIKLRLFGDPDTISFVSIYIGLKTLFDNDKINTAGVDGRHLWLNSDFFMACNENQRFALIIHEVMHVALMHMTRKGDRHPIVWNMAGDYVINLFLHKRGHELPDGGLLNEDFDGMSTEQVYDRIYKEIEAAGELTTLEPGDIIYPGTKKEEAVLERHIGQILQRAQLTDNRFAGTMPGEVSRVLENVTNPRIPWQTIYQNYLNEMAATDYSYQKLNRRFLPEYFPSLWSEAMTTAVIAVDVSGSTSDEEFSSIIEAAEDLKNQLDPEKIIMVGFDTEIKETIEIERYDDIKTVADFTGYGGTDIEPVLEWGNENNVELLVVFTDGGFDMPEPEEMPNYPIIWIIYNNPEWTTHTGKVIHYEIG